MSGVKGLPPHMLIRRHLLKRLERKLWGQGGPKLIMQQWLIVLYTIPLLSSSFQTVVTAYSCIEQRGGISRVITRLRNLTPNCSLIVPGPEVGSCLEMVDLS